MEFKLKNKNNVTLHTKNKYCREDILIGIDDVEKDKIIPENIADGQTILGVTGTHRGGIDTTDATANPSDVLKGKVAYNNEGKIEGTIEEYDGSNSEMTAPLESTLKKLLDYTKTTYHMFYDNKTITDLTGLIDYNDTENVETMKYMFCGCSKLTTIPLFNTNKVTDMSSMFKSCYELISIPQLDTSNVTNMSNMFDGCNKIKKIPLLNTSNVTNMSSMFNWCQSLDEISLSDTSNVTDMSGMFGYCYAMDTIPQLDTSNVTNMKSMFGNCKNTTSIPLLNTSKVTDMSNMFYECVSLRTIPPLDTSKVTTMSSMFSNCQQLLSIPQLDTSKVTNMSYFFKRCYKLPFIDLTYYNISSTSYSANMCDECYSLKAFVIRSFGTQYVLNSNSFSKCVHILGITNSTYNPNGDKDGYIYVPRDMIETLSSATNWSTIATQLRALEDYTKDGTTTGELDFVKMGLEEEV